MKKEGYSILLNEKFRKDFINRAISKFKTQTALAKYLNSRLKRKVFRENIKDWLKGKHKYGWDILIPINILEELCIINSEDIKKVLNEAIKFNPPWKNPKKINLLVKQNKLKTIKKGNKIYLDLATIIPKTTLKSIRSKKKLPLFVNIKENEIDLWSEASWKRSKIKLKRYVELNKIFFIGLAIYASEGNTKGKYNGSIAIGNTEPSIMNLFFKWINMFLVDYKYNCRVEFNGKDCNNKQIINFWKEKLPYVKNLKIPIKKRDKMGSRLINNNGTLNIKISNTTLRAFILNLITKSKKLVLSNKLYSIAYLGGLLTCEGSVYSKKAIKQVSIGSTDAKERRFIKKLLKKLKLDCYEGKFDIGIGNWKSFFNLYKYNTFAISQINNVSKKERFLEGLKNHQKTKKLIRLSHFKNKRFTANDWQSYYNLKSYISSHNYLNPLIKEGYLKSHFINNKKYFYISPEKLKELEFLWKL